MIPNIVNTRDHESSKPVSYCCHITHTNSYEAPCTASCYVEYTIVVALSLEIIVVLLLLNVHFRIQHYVNHNILLQHFLTIKKHQHKQVRIIFIVDSTFATNMTQMCSNLFLPCCQTKQKKQKENIHTT